MQNTARDSGHCAELFAVKTATAVGVTKYHFSSDNSTYDYISIYHCSAGYTVAQHTTTAVTYGSSLYY
jgi:hypothetical protein